VKAQEAVGTVRSAFAAGVVYAALQSDFNPVRHAKILQIRSVFKVAHTGEGHRDAELVAGGDHFFVTL
jgi:hypothetical protein